MLLQVAPWLLILQSALGGSPDYVLPDAVVNNGKVVVVKSDVGRTGITVRAPFHQLIDGSETRSIASGEAATFQARNASWKVVSSFAAGTSPGAHNLLSPTHTDTITSAVNDNGIIIGSNVGWEQKTLPDCDDIGGQHLNYDDTGNSFTCGTTGGGSGAPDDAEYWVGAPHAGLSAEHDLSALATALVVNSVGTPSAYGGTTCGGTGFVGVLDATGVATCEQVATADIIADAVTYAKIQNVSATDRVLGRVSAGAGDVEEVTFSDAAQDQAQDTFADDQVWVADSATAGTPRSVPDCTDTGGNHLNYTAASNSFSCGTTGDGGGWPTGKLTSPVAVAVNATYVTVFTVTPGVSKSNVLDFTILHTASSLLVGVQFRVRSADAGNVGSCTFTHFGINATVQSNVGTFTVGAIAIAAAPVDTAALAASGLAINRVDIKCAFASDGTPGDVVLEAQLETGTTSINILTGSYYNLITN